VSDGDFKLKPGSRVQVNLDCDIFEAMQQNYGGWHPALATVSVDQQEIQRLHRNIFHFSQLSCLENHPKVFCVEIITDR